LYIRNDFDWIGRVCIALSGRSTASAGTSKPNLQR
jgi:hypothetical protein